MQPAEVTCNLLYCLCYPGCDIIHLYVHACGMQWLSGKVLDLSKT